MSAELTIGVSPITNTIFVGKVRTNNDGYQEWSGEKKDVTKMAVGAVVQHIQTMYKETGESYIFNLDGKMYALVLKELDADAE